MNYIQRSTRAALVLPSSGALAASPRSPAGKAGSWRARLHRLMQVAGQWECITLPSPLRFCRRFARRPCTVYRSDKEAMR